VTLAAVSTVGFVRIVRAARIPLAPVRPALVALGTMLLALPALLLRRRTMARPLVRRAMETAQLLAQRVDLALVRRLLPLGLLQHLEHFVELIQ
jgi:hypothetical protein